MKANTASRQAYGVSSGEMEKPNVSWTSVRKGPQPTFRSPERKIWDTKRRPIVRQVEKGLQYGIGHYEKRKVCGVKPTRTVTRGTALSALTGSWKEGEKGPRSPFGSSLKKKRKIGIGKPKQRIEYKVRFSNDREQPSKKRKHHSLKEEVDKKRIPMS